MTQETKMAILADYNDRNIKVEAIAAKYHISRGAVARIAVEQGAPPRNQKKFGAHRVATGKAKRICPKCTKASETAEARFCWNCGADIRSTKQLAIDGLHKVLSLVMLLPDNERDGFQSAVLAAIKELKN